MELPSRFTQPLRISADACLECASIRILETLGEPWHLSASILDGQAIKPGSSIEWGFPEGKQSWKGVVHSVHQQNNSYTLPLQHIEACALGPEHLYHRQNQVHLAADGLEGVLQRLFGDATAWLWPKDVLANTMEQQWLQIQETNLEFLKRIAAKHNCGLSWSPGQNQIWNGAPNACRNQQLPRVCAHSAILHTTITGHTVLEVSTSVPGCHAGSTIQFEEWERESSWRVIRAHHHIQLEGSICGTDASTPFQSDLLLIPAQQDLYWPTHLPRREVMRAQISKAPGAASNQPSFHANGSYPLCFPFEASNAPVWGQIQAMQESVAPYAGSFFPLNPGTQVLVAFPNHQPDTPIILGAIPDAQQPCGANQQHLKRALIQSRLGAFVHWEDFSESRSEVILGSPQGAQLSLSGENATLTCPGTLKLQAAQIELN